MQAYNVNSNNRLVVSEEEVLVYESPHPSNIFAYSPSIAALPGGRLMLTMDIGGAGVSELEGPLTAHPYKENPTKKHWQGKLFLSDDDGLSWRHQLDFPFKWARAIQDGEALYLIGVDGDLTIMRSPDRGESWSEPVRLTSGDFWHQAPCNVLYANGCVYLVMEKRIEHDMQGWYVSELAPVLMRARLGDDLTAPQSWTYASELPFKQAVDPSKLEAVGLPFYPETKDRMTEQAPGRSSAPIGWLETHVIQFTDPDHYWCDPSGHTFHLWARAFTGGTGYAAIAKVTEHPDGSMTTSLEQAPSGKDIVYVPCPGGHMKFHIMHDPQSGLFWLLSTQPTDSMIRADRMPDGMDGLANNERHRLQLHFSRNAVDWCFAGMVAIGDTPLHSRHYAGMDIDGDDLVIASRSGDARAHSGHDGNLILFHRVRDFRSLVY
ncbi:exo-alpha-sialidase [Paenibacillus sp. IB182496]|uniref:Exo-alpha-sialidase n=1 Tax=Paenibacillus sabuli TaxID=2772509 RepID=A0A927BUQ2_9BACL|nr:sialidase family protein [Paenibacillus sabuli]MBD2847181.1 exo-alpha-sialidase [Paenibacillus sabuli]